MIVVSDTSPLNYLVLTGLDHLLPALFGRIIIPEAVNSELHSLGAPDALRRWLASPVQWLEVQKAPPIDWGSLTLDAGEREVIALGIHRRAHMVLLDEAKGRKAAADRGLIVTGTIGILNRAAKRGLIDRADAVGRLRKTSFRASPKLFDSL